MVSGDLQSSYGWKCIGNDMITGRATELPYSDGVFRWPIPLHYKIGEESYPLQTVNQLKILHMGDDGKATLTLIKKQASHSQREQDD